MASKQVTITFTVDLVDAKTLLAINEILAGRDSGNLFISEFEIGALWYIQDCLK